MPQAYTNERLAAYNVNTDGTIDTSVYILEDDISNTEITSVSLELTPPSGYQIKGVEPTTGWSSYTFTGDPISLWVSVPEDRNGENEVDFCVEIMQTATGKCQTIDPKFTVKNTTAGV
ncbi:MAG: hypothetical protein H6711_04815 [Myxococcales bacterium]|nr:hypothetical protein [Myxococcales bacterium]